MSIGSHSMKHAPRTHRPLIRGQRSRLVSAIVGLLALVLAPAGLAAAGSLDTTFDGDGRVTTDLGSPEEGARAVVVQPDGKIVVAGTTTDQDTFVTSTFLLRYDSGGTLDPSFDGDGIVFFNGPFPESLALQSDGKILVTGGYPNDFAVRRFNGDGTPDMGFSGDGLATGDLNGGEDHSYGVAVQADGKVVVVGFTAPNFDARDFAIARFNDDGTLDGSFSNDGLQRTRLSGPNDRANAVAVQANGKIVVAGTTDGRPFESLDFGLVRYLADGTLDTSFNGDGKLRTSFNVVDQAFDVDLQTDGKIVAGGSAGGPKGVDFALARYTPKGKLDLTFSKDGKLRTDFSGGNDEARAVIIQANGRIVLAGFGAPPGTSSGAFALARYRVGGKLDPSFSGDGRQLTKFGSGDRRREHQIYDAALQADGRIVAAGLASPALNEHDVGLARYLTS